MYVWNLSNVNKKDIRTKSLTSFWCVYCWNCVNFTPCSGVSIELYELCFWNFSRIFYPFAKSSVILRHFYVILRHFWVKLHKKWPFWRFRTLTWNSKLYYERALFHKNSCFFIYDKLHISLDQFVPFILK